MARGSKVMLRILVLLIIVVPVIEIWGLTTASHWIGWIPTLAICILTGFVGAWLAKRQGLKVLMDVQRQLERGQLPGDALLDGMSILAGGIFLLTPGFFTDVIGFILLLPWSRRIVKVFIRNWLRKKMDSGNLHINNFNRFKRW